jgi:hypothetical protein
MIPVERSAVTSTKPMMNPVSTYDPMISLGDPPPPHDESNATHKSP